MLSFATTPFVRGSPFEVLAPAVLFICTGDCEEVEEELPLGPDVEAFFSSEVSEIPRSFCAMLGKSFIMGSQYCSVKSSVSRSFECRRCKEND